MGMTTIDQRWLEEENIRQSRHVEKIAFTQDWALFEVDETGHACLPRYTIANHISSRQFFSIPSQMRLDSLKATHSNTLLVASALGNLIRYCWRYSSNSVLMDVLWKNDCITTGTITSLMFVGWQYHIWHQFHRTRMFTETYALRLQRTIVSICNLSFTEFWPVNYSVQTINSADMDQNHKFSRSAVTKTVKSWARLNCLVWKDTEYKES